MTTGDMWPLVNNTPDILLIAPPEGRRTRAFQASVQALGWPAARVVSYLDLLEGQAQLSKLVKPNSIVRFDSPGEDLATEQMLIARGGGPQLDLAAGEIAPMQAWYKGFSEVLLWLEGELQHAAPHQRMQQTQHILTMFDKAATHAKLQAAGVPVPEALPPVQSCEDLLAKAKERGWTRVFVKLNYGSSASGTMALQWSGERVAATTTVRLENGRLYNSKKLLTYRTWPEVHTLINSLAKYRIHVERWLPKANWQGHTMDLRVVTIAGQAKHALVRLGRGPITNLHLGNERGDIKQLKQALGPCWNEIQQTCQATLETFSGALYGGVDVMLTPGWRKHAVLEVNAFGDYHRGVLVDGLDTYSTELLALVGKNQYAACS